MSQLDDTQLNPVDPQLADGQAGALAGADLDSVLDRVIAERDARLQAQAEQEFEIPTWDGKMVAVYQHLSEGDYDRYVQRLGPDPKPSLSQSQDVLIAACKAVILVENGERNVLSDGYNRKLGARLAMPNGDTARARDVVLHMCGGHTLELATHAGDVIEWLSGSSQEVEQKLTGESETS